MQPLHAISNVIKTSLSFFVSDAIEDIEADFDPKQWDIVLFLDERGEWRTGSYQGQWQDVRKVDWSPERIATDDSIEESPYFGETVTRAKVNYASKNEKGEWVVDYIFSYPSVSDILPYDAQHIELALLSNQAHANSVAKDLAVA